MLTIFHVVGTQPEHGLPVRRLGVVGWDSPEPAGDPIDDASWERARIAAGIAEHGRDFGLDTLPQEVGLKRAVSFEKGCYVGQEPVVMLEHRGQPPRRLARVRLASCPDLPAEIRAEGALAGTLTSCVEGLGLALIKRKRLESSLRVNEEALEVLAIVGDED